MDDNPSPSHPPPAVENGGLARLALLPVLGALLALLGAGGPADRRVLLGAGLGAGAAAVVLVWRTRWDIAYGVVYATWFTAREAHTRWGRLRGLLRRWRDGDPPRGTYLHLADGRDLPLTPHFAGERDGHRVWALAHPHPVWIAPHVLDGAQLKGEYMPPDVLLTLHVRRDHASPDLYRFVPGPR